ncbi:hypothetical protein [Curtobacterium sp. RRHDQ10]|uniref:hypothetical protein n=1 Tax=Curtobacterium phyllosphaerae TaxID=3413379 RepID=UPI003BF07E38
MTPVDDRLRLRALPGPTPPTSVPAARVVLGVEPDRSRAVARPRFVVDGVPPVADQPRVCVVDRLDRSHGGDRGDALVRAVAMARDGLDVLVVGERPRSLDDGEAVVPGFSAAAASGRLRWTTSFSAAVGFGDVHVVPVPSSPSGADDHRAVRSTVSGLVARATRRTLVVCCSDEPAAAAGTLDLVVEGVPLRADVEVAWVADPGVRTDRGRTAGLTFGVGSPWAEAQLRALYRRRLDAGTIVTVVRVPPTELPEDGTWSGLRVDAHADGLADALMQSA